MAENAKYWIDKGNDLSNAGNFEEAINCFVEATKLEPDNDTALLYLGNALYNLATIKKDEALFWEAIDKYEKATQLKPDHAGAYNNFGAAFSSLAKIKQDESLFREAIDKYEKATQLKPDYAGAYYNLGIAFYCLAKIKQDEALFREAIDKYEKATQLKPDYAGAFFNRGIAFTYLAKIKKGESLFREATSCFIKSKKDILNILILLDDEERKSISQAKVLYPLLELDTGDGKFFKETTKGKDKLDEYKKAYILSIEIISQLHINDKKEKSVAHYLKKTVLQKILFGNSKFQLNLINYSNDPTEGKILLNHLFEKEGYLTKQISNMGYGAFAGCFIFDHDSLNQFRLYGKEDGSREGTGLSIVFKDSFFSEEAQLANKQLETSNKEEKKCALFRCIYIDPFTKRIETVGQKDASLFFRNKNTEEMTKEEINDIEEKIAKYSKYITDIIVNVREKMMELKLVVKDLDHTVVGQLLINLRYLTKHIAFKEEQECRIIKILPLDENIKIDDYSRMYVEYDPQVSMHTEKIYFGPKAGGMELFRDFLTRKKLTIPLEESKNPLA
ncbi:MAG: tetratricopeptide repeat protein [Treponema sp.]|jgi:tetratricopeptide (TPR) repeat protein|nr:tetratricopeptide repeat protein [Treponema sp.]